MFIKCLWSVSIIVGIGVLVMNKIEKVFCFCGVEGLVRGDARWKNK